MREGSRSQCRSPARGRAESWMRSAGKRRIACEPPVPFAVKHVRRGVSGGTTKRPPWEQRH
eukprot:1347911-Rhodomonas_salina.1